MRGQAGTAIDLPVADGPATGYSWVLDLPPGVTRAPDGPRTPAPPGQELGGGSGGALRVAAPAGRYHIVARLARPWQPDAPIATREIDLIVE
ncbi:protease inhibitor I42 family protein [Glacieibacterium frigidum]|uniref:Uncharacterized protein n=1 Tax=Glacieibacterium frigidum TaxID=2593303 RepID=A0A552UAE2_9SPHN|nr:protease inhibitor I42 family protein [Glacieibacterium frigidum]TRW15182.1 hypothetical protein FMM06_16220 [Glacieibacterium frigidum]